LSSDIVSVVNVRIKLWGFFLTSVVLKDTLVEMMLKVIDKCAAAYNPGYKTTERLF